MFNNKAIDEGGYKKIFNLTKEILCAFYFNGELEYSNSAFNNIFGYDTTDIEELNMFSILHPQDESILKNRILEMKEGQDIVNLRLRCKCKDKKFKWISWNAKFELKEKIIYAAGHDISDSIELEQTVIEGNEKLNTIIENISDLLFICDKQGKYTKFNKSARNIFPFMNHKSSKIGDSLKTNTYYDLSGNLVTYEDIPGVRILKGEKVIGYRVMRDVENIKTYYDINASPIYDDKGNFIAGVQCWRDITKEAIAKLELENNMKMQEEFFLNISHELKTPLNVIYATIQLFNLYIKDGSLTDNSEKFNKYINIIKQNCYRQIKLVNNLVDLSKIQSGFFKLHLSNQDIVSIIENIVQSVSEYVETKGLKIIFDTNIEERVIVCDPTNIERVMLNLISNAIKFSSIGDEILVKVLEKGDKIEISVKDTGIGINEDDLMEIFKRFKQVDKSLSRNSEGSGIGLCLVKSIVELHQGKISVESQIDKGSKFIIELPNKTLEVPYHRKKSIKSKIETINIEFSDIYS
ncbi:PAS domain-containing sensor histidine kinase [Clostridium sp. SHJSY1]|uniref:PAS domain-containing sensor histidine kinase n=1 Tax=Clostridium sp. SHJSY1 TaxID=2942483 RepID=UPI002876BD09|nr:PAS domain-containing sensor histidine kinase [Clostridium sp. SHJSY1]MDS0527046.1 PAS domain-containing sensor histidine kinase [Clostridium sp. SHJSY1]